MDNKEILYKFVDILKRRIVYIFIFFCLVGCFSFIISSYFLPKTYQSSAQIIYYIKNPSSKDEVTSKITLLKTFKKIILSEKNIIETQRIIKKKKVTSLI